MAAVRFHDETEFSVGWTHPEPGFMERAGHAVYSARPPGGVWVIDPPDGDGVEERIRALGEPAGVVQMLDRHERDCASLARRLGVPLHRLPFGGVPGAPFEVVSVVNLPVWKEVALWFEAEHTLAVAESLMAAAAYRAPVERVAVHPMRRLLPPTALTRFPAEHLLLGHGEGLHGPDVPAAIAGAISGSRRRVPALIASLARQAVASRRR